MAGAAEAALKIKVLLDATDAKKGMQDASGAVDGVTKSADSGGKSWGKYAAAFASAGVTAKIVDFGKQSVTAATESQVATDKLAAVFKSMGDTTGKAAEETIAYATELSKKTAVDDEAIMAGQALLATFGNVSNETARSAGVMDRATAAALDLAATGYGSIESNAVMLGKALNDPIKGMAAMSKAGLTFTESQKKQITAMQESGDLLGAQKIILGEVEKQVGGVAEATKTSSQEQQLAYGELQEAIGAQLLPVVNGFMGLMTDLFNFMAQYPGVFTALAAAIGVAAAAFVAMTIATKLQTLANFALGTSFKALPFFWVIGAITLIVGAIIYLWRNCEWFRDAVIAVWNAVKAAFQAAYNFIAPVMQSIWRVIKGAWDAAWNATSAAIGKIMPLITKLANFFRDKLKQIADIIKSYAKLWFEPIKIAFDLLNAAVRGDWDKVIDIFKGIPKRIASALAGVVKALLSPFEDAIQAVKDALNAAVTWIGDKLGGIGDAISKAIRVAKDLYNTFARSWNNVDVTFDGKKMPGPIPDIPGFTFGLPDLPLLAAGGYVTQATLAVVGEGRGAEFVAPEAMLRKVIREESGPTIVVNGALDPDAVARQIDQLLRRRSRRVGGARIEGTSTVRTGVA